MVVLENEQLKVTIKLKGAELCSVINKQDNTEYIWQGNPDVWAYHAPNLFPVVGGLKDNKLRVNGKEYPLGRHGFARTSTFRRIESTPDHAIFSLAYDEETLQAYPYKFEFEIVYRLSGNQIHVLYKVVNKEDNKIFFSLGAHPGFNVPLEEGEAYEDYFIAFEKDEDLVAATLSDKGLFNGQHKEILKGNKLPLKANLFDDDALVFKNIHSRSVALRNNRGTKSVKLDFPNFKELGIWAKPGAPFVCVEPWLGYADSELGHQDIPDKPGIQSLEKGHVFEVDLTFTFG